VAATDVESNNDSATIEVSKLNNGKAEYDAFNSFSRFRGGSLYKNCQKAKKRK